MKRKKIYPYNKQNKAKNTSSKKKLKVKVNKSTTLTEQLSTIYASQGDLATVCLRQGHCCRVACPQMNYSEALNIIDYIWQGKDAAKKKEVLMRCIKNFFSKSLIKPCPLLYDKTCAAYEQRPLNCRLYGMWPQDDYDVRAERLAKVLKIEKEKIPLNTQCPYVRRKNGQSLKSDDIDKMFDELNKIDLYVLENNDASKREEWQKKIAKKWNYRTIHDWILFIFFGEEWLINLTSFATTSPNDAIDELIVALENTVEDMLQTKDDDVP